MHRILKVPEQGMLEAFNAALKQRGYEADESQLAAARRLQQLYKELVVFKAKRRSKLRKLVIHPPLPRSVYFWGGVGRGKSFLMDCFFGAVPYRRKRRVHFHSFMHDVHSDLKRLKSEPDPLMQVAQRIARETRLLCFDEFHVSDIADAMILGRLLEALFERGVILVMTSNYPPDGLYPNGLQRQNFLPTIELIKRKVDVVEIDSGTDYRLRTLEMVATYLVPPDAQADYQMAQTFRRIAGGAGTAGKLEILERELPVLRVAPGVVWFDFAILCGGPRSQNDYLELAREYHTLLLSGAPKMTREMASEARRFTWLIDVLYDHRVKLIMSAAVGAHELYVEGANAHEFVRTVSRLIEMRSHEYLAEPHRTD